ncbi:MAG: sigma-54 dependent transcriptional regulator [Flavipsychrobacter sp.]|nr:sigma-54 dependent transcriptional regulator [Flavipsychrobacter sp.]
MADSTNILIIDDEDKLRGLLKRIISLEGYAVQEANSLAAGLKILAKGGICIVLCDVKLPDGSGVEFVSTVKKQYPAVEIILLTAYGNIPDGVQAMKNGAFDYIVKGDDNDRIIPLISRAAEKLALVRKINKLEEQVALKGDFDKIIGTSTALAAAVNLAKKVATSQTPVLLTGPTGTGKEVFAQAIHSYSPQNNQAFVALNCSALSKDIMESELFGHVAGAFTGAAKDKKGLVEEAKGGTLFLDEIGEMPLELQPKLLRFLENGTYYRVGDTIQRSAQVRLIAATNRDLQKEIQEGIFRSDLYYRIAVFSIQLPMLRERKTDIPSLTSHFLEVFNARTNKQIKGIEKDTLTLLMNYAWPGNIRELKNVIERAVILEDTTMLTTSSLPYELQFTNTITESSSTFQLSDMEKIHIKMVLGHTKGNKTEAARLLNIGLATLYRKIEEYQL